MRFEPEKVADFELLFSSVKEKIRAFEGCNYLALWRDVADRNTFFTYSSWTSENHLEAYRNSKLFKDTWLQTKQLFAYKAEAWSVEQVHELS